MQSLDFYERYVAGVDLLDGWIGTARNVGGLDIISST